MTDLALARGCALTMKRASTSSLPRTPPRLYRFALGRLDGNEDGAEEIVQRG
jgi:hypothetical protein